MHFFWKFLGKATTLVFYKVQHRAYNCLRVRIILHLSVLITGTSIKTFYICYSSPHLKIWFYSVSYSYYIIYFTLESLFNAPTVSKYIFNAYHQPSLCSPVVVIVRKSFSIRFLRKESWKQYFLSCMFISLSVLFYTWSSVLLDVKSLAHCFAWVSLYYLWHNVLLSKCDWWSKFLSFISYELFLPRCRRILP